MSESPLLLSRKQAKALIGVDPYAVCAPMRLGARVYWHKPTLIDALAAMAGKAAANDAAPQDAANTDAAVEDEIERARKRIAKGAASKR